MPPCRWLEKAAAAGPGTARQAHIVRHVRDMWLWSLRRGVGTPCRPTIVTYLCRDDGHVCGGLGDRVKGQNMAFWQVGGDQRPQTSVACGSEAAMGAIACRGRCCCPEGLGSCPLQLLHR